MNTYYLDWSLRNGVTGIFNDGDANAVEHWPGGTDEFLDSLDTPHNIVMESTVHSFVKEWREEFIERCEREGHTLRFTPPRETGRWARELMYDMPLSDFEAPLVIREIAKRGHTKAPSITDDAYIQKAEDANHELMLLRAQGKKEAFADECIALLPEYKTLDDTLRLALGDGKKYSKVVVAAAGMAAKHADSRKEFERLCGLYAHGYPSQIRADLYHWGWSGGAKRARLNGTPTAIDPKTNAKKFGIRKRDDLTLSEFRRGMRWLYSQFTRGTKEPATGTR